VQWTPATFTLLGKESERKVDCVIILIFEKKIRQKGAMLLSKRVCVCVCFLVKCFLIIPSPNLGNNLQ